MNYMKNLDAWLDAEIEKLLDITKKRSIADGMEGFAAFKKAVRDKVLESCNNGRRAARAAEPSKRPRR
jgi:hypothetical protein